MLVGLFIGFMGLSSFAMTEVHLTSSQPKIEGVGISTFNIYDEASLKEMKARGVLSQMKFAEYKSQWLECSKKGSKALKESGILYPWVLSTYLNCTERIENEKDSLAQIHLALSTSKVKEYLRAGPWRQELTNQWTEAIYKWLSSPASMNQKKFYAARLDDALMEADLFAKEKVAGLYQFAGDFALMQKEKNKALYFFKLAFHSGTKGKSLALQKKIEALDPSFSEVAKPMEILPEKGKEDDLAGEIQSALDSKNNLGALQKMLELFENYPGGRMEKKYSEKPVEILLSLLERSNGSSEAANQFVAEMLKADAIRVHQWAKELHRKIWYAPALQLAEKALESLSGSSHSTSLLWIAGRSALFLGNYDQAIGYFDQLVRSHSGSEEAKEAIFRMALLQYRLQNYQLASTLFLKTIEQASDRYELQARYWLARSFEKFDKERALAEKQALIKRYPFSYYGLKLLAESNDGILDFSAQLKLSDSAKLSSLTNKVWLTGNQEAAWNRFLLLSKAGWVIEASAEAAQLPNLNGFSLAQAYWGQLLSKMGQYQLGMSYLSRAQEASEESREVALLFAVYPKDLYQLSLAAAEKKYGIKGAVFRSLIRQESAWTLRAFSTSSAMGLMQMIPPTAAEIARDLKMKIQIPEDMYKPEVNIPMGTYYVSQMLSKFDGSLPLALAAYNGGPTRLKQWGMGRTINYQDEIWFDELPWSETSSYVKAILRNILLDQALERGKINAKLDFWLEYVPQK